MGQARIRDSAHGPLMHPGWTTFPIRPINSDGSCSCGKRDCKDAGKHPAVAWGKKSLAAGQQIPIPPGYGIGLATGARSGVFVVDLDCKEADKNGVESIRALGDLPETLGVLTPSGGYHLYFRYPGFEISNSASSLGPGIDIRGDGGYVVLPPSWHKCGRQYRWYDENAQIADAPGWLLDLLKKPAHGKVRGTTRIKRERLERLAKKWIRSSNEAQSEMGIVLDKVCKGESFAESGERDTILFQLTRDLARYIPEAEPESLAELFVPSLDLMAGEAEGAPTPEDVAEKFSRALADTEGEAVWSSELAMTKDGTPKICEGNAVIVLVNHDLWKGVLAYDERKLRPVLIKEPPWGNGYKGAVDTVLPRIVSDEDATRCATWFTRYQRMPITSAMAMRAMATAAQESGFDLVREYFLAVAPLWDGRPRLDTWLIDYAGAEDTPYVRAVSSKWVISAVARTFVPGCKVDTMLILEGEQGMYKSSLLRMLAGGGENFTDKMPDIESKDAQMQIHGPLVIEIQELDAFSRKEATIYKSFLSLQVDRFRQPYGVAVKEFPRRCVFAGTTNQETYFRDETGNRRFWPVKVSVRCNIEGLAAVRDQIWAEAIVRYRAGEQWWFDAQQEEEARAEQDKRLENDPWTDLVATALRDGVKGATRASPMGLSWLIHPNAVEVTIPLLLEHAIKMYPSAFNRSHEMRMAAVLHKLGWTRHQLRRDGKRVWIYLAPGVTPLMSPTKVGDIQGVGDGVGGGPKMQLH